MAYIRRSPIWPDPRVKPPFGAAEINWGHPLARGLVGCWLFNEGGGPPTNLAQQRPSPLTSGPTWVPTVAGIGMDFSGTAFADGNLRQGSIPAPLTLVVQAIIDSLTETRVPIWEGDADSATWNAHYLSVGTDGSVNANTAENNVFAAAVSGAGLVSINRVYQIGGVWQSATDRRVFLDGIERAQNATSQTPIGMEALSIGNHRITGSVAADQKVTFALAYEIGLSAPTMAWLWAEPYAVLQPIVRRRWFVPAVAALQEEDYRPEVFSSEPTVSVWG